MTGSVGPDELRVGRREREAAIQVLAAHLAEGRLDPDEYEQRVGAALDARTRGALRALFADLPPPSPANAKPVPVPERLPNALRLELAAEGLLMLEEGLRGSITFHHFRAPGRYTSWGREPLTGTVALSWRRIVVWAARGKQVDVPFDHSLRAAVALGVEKSDVLCIEADAGAFHPQRSGQIVYRLRTPSAATICDFWG